MGWTNGKICKEKDISIGFIMVFAIGLSLLFADLVPVIANKLFNIGAIFRTTRYICIHALHILVRCIIRNN